MALQRSSTKTSLLEKVPEITAIFWIMKLTSTAMGESLSDFFVNTLNPILIVSIGFIGFIVFLFIQISSKRYIAWRYWSCVSMIAIFGTMTADVIHVGLGVPYLISSLSFLFILLIVFLSWRYVEKSLSIHSITTRRREYFYWLTVVATFAFGTAVGDLTASTFTMGYFGSIILFGLLLIGALTVCKVVHSKEVLFFWISYVLTRPLGASIADGFGKSQIGGGLGLGDGLVSIVLIIAMIVFVIFITKYDYEKKLELST